MIQEVESWHDDYIENGRNDQADLDHLSMNFIKDTGFDYKLSPEVDNEQL